MQFRSIAIGLSVLATACAPRMATQGPEGQGTEWSSTLADIRPLASEELSCAPDALEFVLLDRRGDLPTEVSVRGCGKNGVYERHAGQGKNFARGTWTLASLDEDVPAHVQADLANIELEQPYQ
jgi:hypothetical protein